MLKHYGSGKATATAMARATATATATTAATATATTTAKANAGVLRFAQNDSPNFIASTNRCEIRTFCESELLRIQNFC
jgi:hypothetical protein